MSQTIETLMTLWGGCWRYNAEDIRYFLRDGAEMIHGIVRRREDEPGGYVIKPLARMSVGADCALLFQVGDAVVRTLPGGSDPAEVAAVWEEVIAGVGGDERRPTYGDKRA